MIEANNLLKSQVEASKKTSSDEKDDISKIEDLLADVSPQDSILSSSNPILDRIVGQGFQGGPVLAQFASRDSDLILGVFKSIRCT